MNGWPSRVMRYRPNQDNNRLSTMTKFNTKAVHSGQEPEKEFGSVIPPIYQTSTFAQEYPAQTKGYDYTRAGNPNFTNLEQAIAALEGGTHATVFSSGLATVTALLHILKPGDKVLGINDMYGGTYRLMTKVFEKMGIGFKTMPFEDLEAVKQELATGSYTLLSFETPTNPLLRITDIEEACAAAKKHDVISFVDNTFASPALQQPLTLGADIVWHSTTKYIGGHSDVVGGAIITNHEQYKEAFDFARLSMGLNPSPFETWLTHRGLKTLGLRMDRHCTNAKSIAHMLEEHPKVANVYYPGLASHPGHVTAAKQMSDFGGMVSFELKASVEETAAKISQFKYFTLAESLGGIESLVNHPATMTHASIPADVRHKAGLADGLVRLSVGIEDVDDLMDDLKVVLD